MNKLLIALSLSATVVLVGCNKQEKPETGATTGEHLEKATEQAGHDVNNAARTAAAESAEAAEDAKDAAKNAAEETHEAANNAEQAARDATATAADSVEKGARNVKEDAKN